MTATLADRWPGPRPEGATLWRRCFATPASAVVTLVVAATVVILAVPLARWALLDATWTGDGARCHAAAGGACWAFIGHKLRFIVFGLYPPDAQWRPLLATTILLGLLVVTGHPRAWRPRLVLAWVAGLLLALGLMRGGWYSGLDVVPTRLWGGLPVTLGLTALGLGFGFPLGIGLALGRRSRRPVPRWTATAIVEGVRGVPLIAVLYLAALIFPLALPSGLEVDKLLLAQAGVALFAAAYLGEAVRAGLQMIPRGQLEAARALGLGWWQAMRLVILPQALRLMIPAFISIAIGFFQDTSLVVIIGIFDLLNTTRVAADDPAWLGFHTEAYLFAGLLYVAGSATLSRYGRWLERRMARRTPSDQAVAAEGAPRLLAIAARP